MAELDLELVRHALQTARQNGFAEVDLRVGAGEFSARLEPRAPTKKRSASPEPPSGEREIEVKAHLVGFLRSIASVGQRLEAGAAVAVVEALGLQNEVEAKTSAEVVEVCVKEGEPVQYGQVLVRMRP
jgi:acetyl-CoA carboxylase biotin carboxyl carrier protein